MRHTFSEAKDKRNRSVHKLSLALTPYIFEDPFVLIAYDRFDGEHRYHAVGIVDGKCLLVVFTNPDPDDETWVHAISLRAATSNERRRYEQGDLD